jgi:hypothetical protein
MGLRHTISVRLASSGERTPPFRPCHNSEVRMLSNEHQRIAELEEQVRILFAEKRQLEAIIEELPPRRIYGATAVLVGGLAWV